MFKLYHAVRQLLHEKSRGFRIRRAPDHPPTKPARHRETLFDDGIVKRFVGVGANGVGGERQSRG